MGGKLSSAFANLDSQTEAMVGTGAMSLQGNQSWDDNGDLFSLKIAKEFARAFLMQILLTIMANSG
jgi:hypothetical protein